MFKRRFFVFIFLLTYFLAIHSEEASSEWMGPDKLFEINATSGIITNDPTHNTWIVNVNDDPGLGVEIVIDKLSVDPDEFFLLAGGRTANEESTMIQILTGTFESSLYYRLPNTRSFYLKFSSAQGIFNLTYESYGEIFTTNTPPTDNPNPPRQVDTTYEVLLKGKPPADFFNDTIVYSFSRAAIAIAKKYCAEKNITFEEKPWDDTVFLHLIRPCSPNWPGSETCAAVNHSIFVSGTRRLRKAVENYELAHVHLQEMWEKYGTEELADIGLSIYDPPDSGNTILWWLLLIGICLLVAIISLLVFWKFEHIFIKTKKEEQPLEIIDGVEIRQKNRHRLSEYQHVPTYMTEPDSVLKYSKGSQRDKQPAPKPPAPKPPALTNLGDIGTSPTQQSPLSPVTPAASYSAGLYFNYNRAFVEDDEEGLEV